jgi:dTDP-4-amino-4,6-dideoxygalactose transaminase
MHVPLIDLKAQYETIQHEVLQEITRALNGMDLLKTPNVRAFEAEFAAYCRTRFAIGVGSGTHALYLALRACGVNPGDEVITPAYGSLRAVQAIVLLGAVPVFVDVEPGSFTLDPACLPETLGPRTRAIVAVHLYGHAANMAAIVGFAQRFGLVVVEDACEAHGAEEGGQRVGGLGDAAAFSFSVAKNLGAYGDAGAVTTNSRAVALVVRELREHESANGNHQRQELGIASRMDELQAVILRVKLRYLDSWNERREEHARAYAELLGGVEVALPSVRTGSRHAYYRYVIQTHERDHLAQVLADRGIVTSVDYGLPIHQQPACMEVGRIPRELRVAERLGPRILSLPMYPELEREQLAYVALCLREHVGIGSTGHRQSVASVV